MDRESAFSTMVLQLQISACHEIHQWVHKLTIYYNISIHMSEATRILGNASNVHVVLFISEKMVLISVAVRGQFIKQITLIGIKNGINWWTKIIWKYNN